MLQKISCYVLLSNIIPSKQGLDDCEYRKVALILNGEE